MGFDLGALRSWALGNGYEGVLTLIREHEELQKWKRTWYVAELKINVERGARLMRERAAKVADETEADGMRGVETCKDNDELRNMSMARSAAGLGIATRIRALPLVEEEK